MSIVLEPKYGTFARLQCVVLRCLQMMLRVAVGMGRGPVTNDLNAGMWLFKELLGEGMARQAYPVLLDTSRSDEEPTLACDSLLVLAELGPQVLAEPSMIERMLELFLELPDRADELVEVALRIHAAGGKLRRNLLEAAVEHHGGKHMFEVLIHVVNRADRERRIRAVKVLTGCLLMPTGGAMLYSNDACVLVEILLRELPNSAEDSASFKVYATLIKVLVLQSNAARVHRHADVVQVLEDLRDYEHCSQGVYSCCVEVLQELSPTHWDTNQQG